jgi:uncharacterized protein
MSTGYEPPVNPQTPGPSAPPPSYGPRPMNPSEERTWAMLSHLGALGVILFSGLLGFVVPLVVMATKGNESPYVRRHAVASLNFQLTLLLVVVVGSIAGVIATILTLGLGLLVIVPAAIAYAVFAFVVMIVATVRANEGREYDYPLSITFVS